MATPSIWPVRWASRAMTWSPRPRRLWPRSKLCWPEAGSDKSRILMAQIWLADMADFEAMNSVWDAWVDTANPPARATGESRLATPDYRVEIIVTASKG